MKNNFHSNTNTHNPKTVKSKFGGNTLGNNRLNEIRANNLVKKIQIIYRLHCKLKKMKKDIDLEKKVAYLNKLGSREFTRRK
jgi:hypothetical protein